MDRWTYEDDDKWTNSSEQLLTENEIRLYDGDDRSSFEEGRITATAHMLYWTDTTGAHGGRTIGLHLKQVKAIETQIPSFFSMSSPKVVLQLDEVSEYDRKDRAASEWVRFIQVSGFCRLGCESKAVVERIVDILKSVIAAAQWKKVPVAPSQRFGLAGRAARAKKEIAESESRIKDAFQGDLEELKARAKDMVKLSEAFTQKLKRGDASDAEAAEFQAYVVSMGIADPVTKNACRGGESAFHRELAAELGRFLEEPIQRAKGMLQLQDVYCLYNRARGTMLISPNDLVAAAAQFEVLGIPLLLRTFDSGVKVVQSAAMSDEKTAVRVCELVTDNGSMTPGQLARIEDISAVLAKEMLLAAESLGRVCRDDTVEGLSFYPNRFLTEG